MQIHLLTIGKRMPRWVDLAYQDYAKRLSADCRLQLSALDMPKRGKNQAIDQLREREADSILQAMPAAAIVVALDQRGHLISTQELAQQIAIWQHQGQPLCFIIGGPDGLARRIVAEADQVVALSRMTLPHPLVRVILVEQIYRAFSILRQHPYHR